MKPTNSTTQNEFRIIGSNMKVMNLVNHDELETRPQDLSSFSIIENNEPDHNGGQQW